MSGGLFGLEKLIGVLILFYGHVENAFEWHFACSNMSFFSIYLFILVCLSPILIKFILYTHQNKFLLDDLFNFLFPM